jgi:DNA processing protein
VGRRGDLSGAGEREALLLLRLLPGLGDRGASLLLRRLGSARAVLEHPTALEELAGPDARRAARSPELRARTRELPERAAKLGIVLVGITAPDYPPRLHDLHDPPPVLFLKGRSELLSRPMVAIVGCRRATGTGRRVAERLGRDLSLAGVTVTSGLALGVDGAAHRGALDGAGSTVAVLGRGPDRAYPVAHGALFRRIAREGLLVSEFPPGEPVRRHHFPRRNRILAALAAGVVVVEAGSRSGALITVEHALDLGRQVMAVPGSVEHVQSVGSHALIRDGAALVTDAREVLETLEWRREPPPDESGDPPGFPDMGPGGRTVPRPAVPGEVGRLEGLLGPAPIPLEDLLERSGLPPGRALALLTRLEIQGRARRDPEGWIREGR